MPLRFRQTKLPVLAAVLLLFACGERNLEIFPGQNPTNMQLDAEVQEEGAPPTGCASSERDCICQDDPDCSSERPRCDQASHHCVECLIEVDCAGDDSACNPYTMQCANTCSDHCRSSPDVCDLVLGLCVECLDDGDCTSERPRCLQPREECVECLSDVDCEGSTRPHCNTSDHDCVR